VLDGRIARPTLDLRFPLLNRTLGLRDVTARLDPTATGFALRAAGGSRLGPFTADGAILLPPGGQASVAMTALDVAGARASGRLAIVPGGFLVIWASRAGAGTGPSACGRWARSSRWRRDFPPRMRDCRAE
jgi:translocation and assembly module TamB